MSTIDDKHVELLQEIVEGVKEAVKVTSSSLTILTEKVHQHDIAIERFKNNLLSHEKNCPINEKEIERMTKITVNDLLQELPKERLVMRTSRVSIVTNIVMAIVMLLSMFVSVYVLWKDSSVDKNAIESEKRIERMLDEVKKIILEEKRKE